VKHRTAPTHPPEAISYIRFSSPQQAEGDSLRRQTAAARVWCDRNGIPLNTSLSTRDLGRSAYHGRHRDEKAALGAFLEAVRAGKVPRGWFLVIENLDRLSREDERTALRLWMDILDAGINIVQLHPETVFRHERSDMTDIIRAIIELSRGHSESLMKSMRAAALWEGRRVRASQHDELMTTRLPYWIEIGEDGLQRLIPERAAAVRRVFQLSAAGYGRTTIAKKLTAEKVPAFGACVVKEDGRRKAAPGQRFGCGEWRRGYVDDILRDRRALGEFTPRDRDGRALGDPIPDYYIPVVTVAEFYAAQAATASRRLGKRARGRIGTGMACVFSGLLTDARGGGAYYAHYNGKVRALVNKAGAEGMDHKWTFPIAVFERAILSRLSEIDLAAELTPRAAPTEADALRAERDCLRAEIEAFRAALTASNSVTVAQELAKRETRVAKLTADLEGCEEEAASPLSEAAAEVRRLTAKAVFGGRLAKLDAAQAAAREDARHRLRAVLRRVIDSVYMLVVHRSESRAPRVDRRGRVKLLTAQVNFVGGGMRTVRVVYRPAKKAGSKFPKPAEWRVDSIEHDDVAYHLDLRKPEDAAEALADMARPDWGPDALAFGEVMTAEERVGRNGPREEIAAPSRGSHPH
jgi:DNA invertase Pin-like site-specific DNA recombinase